MIHSLEDKTKRELIDIVKIQVKEYQLLTKRIAELEKVLITLNARGGLGLDNHKLIEEVLKGGDV